VVNDHPSTTYPVGNTTVKWTVTDINGLTATCDQTVTVIDNQAPTPICQNITVTLDADGRATITPAQVNNGSTDNCGTVNLVSVVPSSFTYCNVGANPVTLTMNDGKGNTATCTPTVTVRGGLCG
jgi:flagellar basal body rod protein FlgF